MHIDFLIEDASGKIMLEGLLPSLLPESSGVTWTVRAYKGVGHIPERGKCDPAKIRARALLDNVPRILAGIGSVAKSTGYAWAVIVVCDLDDKDRASFMLELNDMLDKVKDPPPTRFCLAVEEGEAWFLGDIPAIVKAYPKVKKAVLNRYRNDSICGTWELMADAVYPGGADSLKSKGYRVVGVEKCTWAREIPPYMNVPSNKSPSFRDFVGVVTELAKAARL